MIATHNNKYGQNEVRVICCRVYCKSVVLCKQPVVVTGRCLHCACLLCVVTINSLLWTISTDNGTTVTATLLCTICTLPCNSLHRMKSKISHHNSTFRKLIPLLRTRLWRLRCENTVTPRLTTNRSCDQNFLKKISCQTSIKNLIKISFRNTFLCFLL